jgi:voltage-gated potassium channel
MSAPGGRLAPPEGQVKTDSEHHVRHTPYLLFILILSVFALLALAIERLVPLAPETLRVLAVFDYAVCAVFLVDFVVCLKQAENRWRYLMTWGWLDLLSAVPMVEAFRITRSARIVRVVRLLRALRVARILFRSLTARRAESALLFAILMAFVVLGVSSVAILQAEQDPQSNIRNAEDAIWWSISTMTTVGYGDRYPVTSEGRVVASLLMIAGVGLFGTLSGFFAAWFVAPGDSDREQQIRSLRAEVAEIRRLLEQNSRASKPTGEPLE